MRRLLIIGAVLGVFGAAAPAVGASGWAPADSVQFPEFRSKTHGQPWMLAESVGDVDGDGVDDVGVGLSSYDPGWGRPFHVIFGRKAGSPDPGGLGTRPGFRVEA